MKKLAALCAALAVLVCGLAPTTAGFTPSAGRAEEAVWQEQPSEAPPAEQEAADVQDAAGEPEETPAEENEPEETPKEDEAPESEKSEAPPANQSEDGTPEALPEDEIIEPEVITEDESIIEGGEAVAYIDTENGERYGQPDELIRALLAVGGGTLHLLCRTEFAMDDVSGEELALIDFSCASERDRVVYQAQDGTYCFWVEEIAEEAPEPDGAVLLMSFSQLGEASEAALLGAPTSAPPTLAVAAPSDFQDGVWTSDAPAFALSADRALDEAAGERFGVIVDGAEAVPLQSGASCTYQAGEGRHTLQFVILDPSGALATDPSVYRAWVDTVPPVIEALTQEEGTLYVTARDASSGVAQISVDGGNHWQQIKEWDASGGVSWGYRAGDGARFEVGQIVVRDAAGNRSANQSAYVIAVEAADTESIVAITASKRKNGTVSRTVFHAESTDRSTTAYNAVELDVEPQAMTALCVGEQSLDLLLYGEDQNAAMFTAGLARWDAENGVCEAVAGGDASADTLVLSAVETGTDAGEQRWEVNGQTLRKLANSGVSYLVLKVGDNVTTLSTSGFTAGLRYDLLKAQGVASSDMSYAISMTASPGAMEMTLGVEDRTFAVSGDQNSELYYYNVFSGSPDLLQEAFGAFAARNQG